MLSFRRRPYHLLIATAIILVVASFFTMDGTMDIHLHDTYYILPTAYATWATALFLLVLWGAYLFTARWLFSKALVWVHVLLTVATAFLLSAHVFNFDETGGMAGTPRRYIDYSGWEQFLRYQRLMSISFAVFVFGPVLYLLNLAIGLIAGKKAKIN